MPNQPLHLTAARLRIETTPYGCGGAAAGDRGVRPCRKLSMSTG
jgi:hypothetical protein